MKHIIKYSFFLFVVACFASCMKKTDITYTDPTQVEWDWATYNAKTSGYPFTLLNRVPLAPGRQVYTGTQAGGAAADPGLTRLYTDTIRMRVNLVGAQQSKDQTFAVVVDPTFTTAVENTHYKLVDRTVTIPAKSSFGFVRWVALNPGTPPTGTLPVQVVFQLRGNSEVSVSENFQYLGWIIAQ